MRWAPLLCIAAPLFAFDEPVRVDTGLLSGTEGRDPSIRVFKGIPYAGPPIAERRWEAPMPATAWTGVREAREFPAQCMQPPYPANSIYRSASQPNSEDCLYLNVWTASKKPNERRPVMVWIHGGGLTRGSGSTTAYDGEAFAKKGVVLVTINYRLGVFGFLAHPELTKESDRNASGNYGLLDQIAALEWVKRNINAFGGDPDRVTIFGESAGSWSVNYLMATPLAKGLFHRAIGESGGTFGIMRTLAEAEAIGTKFASGAGADSIAALRAKPADEVLSAAPAANFSPNVDGWMLKEDVYTIFASGKQSDVPLLLGSNADEGTSLAPWPATSTAATFVSQARKRFGADADAFLKLYPASTDEEAKSSHYASFRDMSFGWQMRTWARLQTKTGKSKAYLYYFSRRPPGPMSDRLGAYHAAEVPYVFDTLDLLKRPCEDADHKLADQISAYWVNFATTGNPNGKGLVDWPVYTASSDTALELGDSVKTVHGLHREALDFLDGRNAAQRLSGRRAQ